MNTGIFRCELPFVYGLIKFSQKPERQQYTDTIRELERRAPNHYRERRRKYSRYPRTDLRMKAENLVPGKKNRAENRAENRRATSRRIIATQGRAVQLTNTT
jgi:hypothetical protein